MISLKKLYSIYQKHPKIVTDSRKIEPGCLFFALKGTNVDGNQFAQQAIDAGARRVVEGRDGPHAREDVAASNGPSSPSTVRSAR